jgi:hypothetical protein
VSTPVDGVALEADGSQVCNPVICLVSVDVVKDIGRLFSVVKKPSDAVSKVGRFTKSDSPVPTVKRPSNIACPDILVDPNKPPNITRLWAVAQYFTSTLWNNLCSHFESPLNLVRGAVAPTTVTPIISRSVRYATQ